MSRSFDCPTYADGRAPCEDSACPAKRPIRPPGSGRYQEPVPAAREKERRRRGKRSRRLAASHAHVSPYRLKAPQNLLALQVATLTDPATRQPSEKML